VSFEEKRAVQNGTKKCSKTIRNKLECGVDRGEKGIKKGSGTPP